MEDKSSILFVCVFLQLSKSGNNHECAKRDRHAAAPHLARLATYPLKRQEFNLSCNEAEKSGG
jgi:hypothetical protein